MRGRPICAEVEEHWSWTSPENKRSEWAMQRACSCSFNGATNATMLTTEFRTRPLLEALFGIAYRVTSHPGIERRQPPRLPVKLITITKAAREWLRRRDRMWIWPQDARKHAGTWIFTEQLPGRCECAGRKLRDITVGIDVVGSAMCSVVRLRGTTNDDCGSVVGFWWRVNQLAVRSV